jgi:hypothetical protein
MHIAVIEEFLTNIPLLHSWDRGVTWNAGGFSRRELEVLVNLVEKGFNKAPLVLETGAGNSTIAFLAAGARALVSIAPEVELFDRIRSYCSAQGIDTHPLEQHIAFSEDVLPSIATRLDGEGAKADIALIDGGHGWPTVFVDFCYLFRSLNRGGYLIVDDIHIYSIKELARFLMEDPNLQAIEILPKTIVFKKLTDRRYLPDFGGQPYVRRRMLADREAGLAFKL